MHEDVIQCPIKFWQVHNRERKEMECGKKTYLSIKMSHSTLSELFIFVSCSLSAGSDVMK